MRHTGFFIQLSRFEGWTWTWRPCRTPRKGNAPCAAHRPDPPHDMSGFRLQGRQMPEAALRLPAHDLKAVREHALWLCVNLAPAQISGKGLA